MTPAGYERWCADVPECVRGDALWRMEAYRLALFLGDAVARDTTMLLAAPALRLVAPQLSLAVGSIGANIAEGYGRSGPRDRARFYEYALGSAREARVWYLQAVPALGRGQVRARLDILTSMIRLLTVAVRAARTDPRRGDRD